MRWLFCVYVWILPFFASAVEDVISLSSGLQRDFLLDESFSGKKLKFEGTYAKFTGLVYDPKTLSIRFSPRRNGVGTLHIKEGRKILKKYTVEVRKTDLNRIVHEMRQLLKEIDGITIKIINKKVIVDGEIFVPRDMKRIYSVVQEYGKQAASFVTLSASAQNKVARFMEREIGNPNITVKAANEKFILRGTVSSPEEKRNALVIAQLYAPGVVTEKAVAEGAVRERNVKDVIIDLIKVEQPPKKENRQNKLIQLVVHYIELEKTYDNQFRFQWAPAIEDKSNFTYGESSAAGDVFRSITGVISNFIPKLNWAKSFGFARILHSSNLIVEEDVAGKISAKINYPYRTFGGPNGTPSVEFAEAGVEGELKAKIVGVRKDGVRLGVNFKIANFLGTFSGAPIVSNRSITTSLFVRSGLSAAIGGVVSSSNNSGFNREPSESKGEPLFNLLASKDFQKNQNQFVVFVTPIIKSSASSGVEEIKQKFRVDR